MAHVAYLFRLDGSRDNDEFMARRSTRCGDRRYAGTPLKLGPGWIPDFVEVVLDEITASVRLTLIKLEATEKVALESSRKYIPEKSEAVVRAFLTYLDGVLAQCRATADPRLETFQRLMEFLEQPDVSLRVETAGALRASDDLLEAFPLLDQPDRSNEFRQALPITSSGLILEGRLRLGRETIDGLRRAVRILHAVRIKKDHSDATLGNWASVGRKLLARALDPGRHKELARLFAVTEQSGLMIDCEQIVTELADVWHAEPQQVRRCIESFHGVAYSFYHHAPMRDVFEKAMRVMSGAGFAA
jgi:hypothetical protein